MLLFVYNIVQVKKATNKLLLKIFKKFCSFRYVRFVLLFWVLVHAHCSGVLSVHKYLSASRCTLELAGFPQIEYIVSKLKTWRSTKLLAQHVFIIQLDKIKTVNSVTVATTHLLLLKTFMEVLLFCLNVVCL